ARAWGRPRSRTSSSGTTRDGRTRGHRAFRHSQEPSDRPSNAGDRCCQSDRLSVGRLPAVQHQFTGPAYTIGIEEEMMILDAESLELVNAIESLLEATPAGEIKPELMESVLEISTEPCENTAQAGEQRGALRRQVADAAAQKNLA